MVKTVKINGENLQTLSVFPSMMTVPDCVVVGSNKLGRGHGEAKFISHQKMKCTAFMVAKNLKQDVLCSNQILLRT